MSKGNLFKVLVSPLFLLFLSFLFLIYWFSFLISSEPWPSSDLPFHINTIESLKSFWYEGTFSFYDPHTFTGWPSLQFYGFFPFLVTAIFSSFLDLFFENSTILSINILIVFVSSFLIFSLYYASIPFFNDLFDDFSHDAVLKKRKYLQRILVLTLFLFCLWFLNSDHQDASVGIGAPMFTGLYGQMFGWHTLILYIGVIARVIKYDRDKDFILLSLIIFFSFLCHTLSAMFTISIGFLSVLWFSGKRLRIIKAHLIGMGLLGFWFIPLLHYMGEFTIFNPQKQADFLGVILRYPIIDFFKSVKSTISGNFVLINYTYVFVWSLILTAFISKEIRKTKLLKVFLFFIVFLIAVFSSDYIINSVPIGIHYYRFSGLIMLLFVLFLSVVSLVWFKVLTKVPKYENIFGLLFVSILLICFLFNLFIPHRYLSNFRSERDVFTEQFKEREKLLDYFIKENSQGRVYFEYLNNYTQFPPLFSHHYLPSIIYEKTGYESIVGVQILQSKSYRYIIERLGLLNSFIYTPETLNSNIDIGFDSQLIIDQLKSFGITHIVAGSKRFIDEISQLSLDELADINGHKIIKIQNAPFKKVELSNKILIGYIDKKGNLPFSLIDHYFFSTIFLTRNFELVQINDENPIPSQIKIVIINEEKNTLQKFKDYSPIKINFEEKSSNIDHYRPIRYKRNSEISLYMEIAGYLENDFNIQKKLEEYADIVKITDSNSQKSEAILDWSSDGQSFELKNLIPGNVYRINYSYFPYWHTKDGILLRGSTERMFFIPNKTLAYFKYTNLYSSSTWIGLLISLISVCYIGWFYRRSD